MSEAIATCSFDDFLMSEQIADRRHELVGGRVYAMAGGSERHDLVAGLIYELVAPGARSRGCRPFTSNRLLRTVSGNAYHPDVLVVCGPAPHRLYESSPTLIVEVLSHSTADVDRRERLSLTPARDPFRCCSSIPMPAGSKPPDPTRAGSAIGPPTGPAMSSRLTSGTST